MYVLYSFRRCPYAIRARMVLEYSQLPFFVREVSLKNKPPELLHLSSKEKITVPVLHQPDSGFLLEESWDMIKWALQRGGGKFDGACWWMDLSTEQQEEIEQIREENDSSFKYFLDRYKYPQRYQGEWLSPDSEPDPVEQARCREAFWRSAREGCARTLQKYELRLQRGTGFLLGNRPSLADIAVMSFVRQFAHVSHPLPKVAPVTQSTESKEANSQSEDAVYLARNFPLLNRWLESWKNHPLFLRVMDKGYQGRIAISE